ncbi:MAG: hypothetical protein KKC76_13225 [Proteobacteria bacterium]|nr:hypothetical protein [Pseudomonadota bacterium]MBU4294877.1 hypothetical protein [Pseudomonadota bacterium]MCG2746760.1 hypothetical protein [Desulfobulbaceae bacterium]
MRIWDIDPGYLNRQSLLGEHRELHAIFVVLTQHKKGYAAHPETRRWKGHLAALGKRHDLLVEEMRLRGYNHHSPLPVVTGEIKWPKTFIDPPHAQFAILQEKYRDKEPGRIPLPSSARQLWAQHKYSVLARDTRLYKIIGPWLAATDNPLRFRALAKILVRTLRFPPAAGRLQNGLDHMWGYVSHLAGRSGSKQSPRQLLQLTRELAASGNIAYLLASTALGEVGAWMAPQPLSTALDAHMATGEGDKYALGYQPPF